MRCADWMSMLAVAMSCLAIGLHLGAWAPRRDDEP